MIYLRRLIGYGRGNEDANKGVYKGMSRDVDHFISVKSWCCKTIRVMADGRVVETVLPSRDPAFGFSHYPI